LRLPHKDLKFKPLVSSAGSSLSPNWHPLSQEYLTLLL
jgi:hypothetical protein